MIGYAILALAAAPLPAADAIERCDPPLATASADTVAACLQRVRGQADVALNTTYRRALAGLPPPDQAALRAAQRAWLAFRALDRRSLTGAWRGSRATRVRIEAARADVTAITARTAQLQAYLVEPARR